MQWQLHMSLNRMIVVATGWRPSHPFDSAAGAYASSTLPEERKPMSAFTAQIDLPPTMVSVPSARHVVNEVLRAWNAPQAHDDAALLVTELVSNVIDHAGSEAAITLQLELADDWLRISVADGSSIPPVVRELNRETSRGRGMAMVEAIADRWGVDEHRGGKRVWFELRPVES
jgi:anti-sigma regulatory factor (Ser/Thr protein kinase)